MSRNQT